MNEAKLRLNAASHSARVSFSGELGACPAVALRSAAVDNAEAAELGFLLAYRPRRKISRAVAPTPPARRKPTPRAPIATAGRLARTLALTLVASPISSRSVSAAPASCSRSDSMSRRTSSRVRLLLLAIALEGLGGQLRFPDRQLGDRGRALLDFHSSKHAQRGCEREDDHGRDQQSKPGGHCCCERGRDRRECEAEHEEKHDRRAERQRDADPKRGDLALELQGSELELKAHDRARALRDVLDRSTQAVIRAAVSPLRVHGLSSRSTSPA